MKIKKAGLVAAGMTALIVLAGCSAGSGSSPSSSPTKESIRGQSINYWYWEDDTTDQTINRLAANFKADTGVTVNLNSSVAQPQFYDKLVNAIAAGNAPDVTHLNTNMMGQLISSNVLEPLNSDLKAWKDYDTVIPTMWSYVTDPKSKNVYAMPNKFLMFYMYYRKDILAAAGVDVPKTQAEFAAAVKKLYDPANNHYGFDFRGGANGQDQWAAFLAAGGAQFQSKSGAVAFDSAASKKANDVYLGTAQYGPPGAVNDGYAQILANLQSGTASIIINHLGAAKVLDAALGDKVGVALIPSATGDPKKTTYMGTMNSNAILASSKHKAADAAWIEYLASNDAQVAIARSTNGYVPVTKKAASLGEFTSNPNIAISLEAAKNSVTSWPLLPGTTAATTKTWQPLFQGAVLKKNANDAVVEGVASSLKNGN